MPKSYKQIRKKNNCPINYKVTYPILFLINSLFDLQIR